MWHSRSKTIQDETILKHEQWEDLPTNKVVMADTEFGCYWGLVTYAEVMKVI